MVEFGQIKWQSRRGMRELDLMLLPFVDIDLPKMDAKYIDMYMDLLKASDLELFRWLHGIAKPDTKEREEMINIIIKCHSTRVGVEGV